MSNGDSPSGTPLDKPSGTDAPQGSKSDAARPWNEDACRPPDEPHASTDEPGRSDAAKGSTGDAAGRWNENACRPGPPRGGPGNPTCDANFDWKKVGAEQSINEPKPEGVAPTKSKQPEHALVCEKDPHGEGAYICHTEEGGDELKPEAALKVQSEQKTETPKAPERPRLSPEAQPQRGEMPKAPERPPAPREAQPQRGEMPKAPERLPSQLQQKMRDYLSAHGIDVTKSGSEGSWLFHLRDQFTGFFLTGPRHYDFYRTFSPEEQAQIASYIGAVQKELLEREMLTAKHPTIGEDRGGAISDREMTARAQQWLGRLEDILHMWDTVAALGAGAAGVFARGPAIAAMRAGSIPPRVFDREGRIAEPPVHKDRIVKVPERTEGGARSEKIERPPAQPPKGGTVDDAIDQREVAESIWARKKAVAHGGGMVDYSGYGYSKKPGDFPQRIAAEGESAYYVRRYQELSGLEPRRGNDNRVAGDEFAAHAEVKNRIHQFEDGTNTPTGVSQDMCGSCRLWHQRTAHRQETRIVVADPSYVRAFKPDGSVEIYSRDGQFLRTVPALEPPAAGVQPQTYEGVDW